MQRPNDSSMFDRYRPLLKVPGAWWLLASSLAGRLPLSTSPLAVLLLMRATTHSFSDSGIASGAIALSEAACAPIIGRLLDRVNLVALVAPLAVIQVLSMVTLVVSAEAHVPVPILILLCAVVGGSMPPVSAAARMLWGRLVDSRTLRDTAYTLDSTGQEIAWTVGPVLVGGLIAAFSAGVAALAVAAIALTSTAWFLSTAWRLGLAVSPTRVHHRTGSALSLRDPMTAVMVVIGFVIGVSFGAFEVALPALADHLGSPGISGALLALWSCGSMVGGVVFGMRNWNLAADRMLMVLFLANAALAIPVAFAANIPWALVACVIAGVCGAPMLASITTVIADNTAPETVGEAFTWNTAAIVSGIAIGAALSGVIVTASGVTEACLLSVVMGLLAGAVTFVFRRRFHSGAPGEPATEVHHDVLEPSAASVAADGGAVAVDGGAAVADGGAAAADGGAAVADGDAAVADGGAVAADGGAAAARRADAAVTNADPLR